jgi:hypothetical protein
METVVIEGHDRVFVRGRMGVRFWEDEVKRLEQAARTAEAGKGSGK